MRRAALAVALLLATGVHAQPRTPLTRAMADALYCRLTRCYSTGGTDVAVADGGTGRSTATAFAPLFGGTTSTGAFQSGTAGTAGQVLTSNGAGALPTFQAAAASGGDLVGPASATDNAIVRFDATTGKLVQNSAVTIDDTTGTIRMPSGAFVFFANEWLGIVANTGLRFYNQSADATATFNSAGLNANRTYTLQDSSGTLAHTQNKLSSFAATTSAELAGVISNETGSGLLPFATAPVFTGVRVNTSITNGSGMQHTRAASCSTLGIINASCDTTVTWPIAFADTSYTAIAMLDSPTGGLVFILSTKNKTTTSIDVTLVTLTAAVSSGTINLVGMHD